MCTNVDLIDDIYRQQRSEVWDFFDLKWFDVRFAEPFWLPWRNHIDMRNHLVTIGGYRVPAVVGQKEMDGARNAPRFLGHAHFSSR